MGILRRILDFVMDILETVTFVGSIFIVVYLFIMQPNQVKGASMEPTLLTGDYIFTSKITYKFRPIQRGDIVVFKSPKNPDIEFIKRVIALPEDKVEIISGEIFVNDQIIDENYIAAKTVLWEGGYIKDGVPMIIPEDHIFVMGDNRPRSSDSREFGPVPIANIIGQVFYRYYPPQKIGGIINPFPESLKSRINFVRKLAFK
ncbi:signal peptidase I [Candidatus Roizmanbacteria bacterium]|nr:signal peptidase I [Candidatus Roizmanbacteria bacterium]